MEQIPIVGFQADKEAASLLQAGSNVLPRAVLRPNPYFLLDGEWRFSLDLKDSGLRESWYVEHPYERIAVWPGSIESHMAEAKEKQQHTPAWMDKIIAWYEREFSAPAPPVMPSDAVLQLTFGACGYETRVWLNGQPLSTIEGEEVHYGEYTSFSYELPAANLRPVNRLTVRIADTMDAEIPRGKQESHVYKRGGIWYQTYTGAIRSVWLEAVERNRLRSRVGIVSVIEDRLVCFHMTTRINDPGLYTLRLQIFDGPLTSDPVAVSEFPLRLDAGQKLQHLVVEIPEALAQQKGIGNGSKVKVTSARGSIEGTAMVTKRMPAMKIDGKDIWQIGFPIHWGYAAAEGHTGPLANFLTASVGDPNTWTPEYKAFLVKLDKA